MLTVTAAGLNTVTSMGTISNDDAGLPACTICRTASSNTIGQAQTAGNGMAIDWYAFVAHNPRPTADRLVSPSTTKKYHEEA
ncbi:hypothetical protein HNO88_004352 [Novosphingobium chloroacetimidivorans]|uniref:Uncharacterized protein n=1 Tax=Novosphingobium chloroacetimidivorans TaxID=1428314 RepID=A0A7W7NY24_9SPHN|nr:hypothetical protein [Novosphingobium chloroacetimidivorans]MBB4861006.1 hypothetical protein [Novosphingobium chloroacetimidivorans]